MRCGTIREIVDASAEAIERYRSPVGDEYDERAILRAGQTIGFAAFPDDVFRVEHVIVSRRGSRTGVKREAPSLRREYPCPPTARR